ncbi:uncharacterized protein ISCGN_005096 [Ixodes scapularis]
MATFRTNALIYDFDGDCKKFGFPFPAWTQPRSGWWSSSFIPYLGHSYILKYEYQEFFANQPAWVEEYFDAQKKRAKIMAVSLGVEFADIYDYKLQRVTSYKARKPCKSKVCSTRICLMTVMKKKKKTLQNHIQNEV